MLALCACSPAVTTVPRVEQSAVIDFRELSADGFYVSPNAFSEPHTPLGLIFLTAQAGGTFVEIHPLRPYPHWVADELPANEALGRAKQLAIAMGADALVNVSIEAAPRRLSGGAAESADAPGGRISGLAIKRGP